MPGMSEPTTARPAARYSASFMGRPMASLALPGREADARGGDVGRDERAVGDEADQADALGDAVLRASCSMRLALLAVADEHEQRARAPRDDLRERLDHGREVVPPGEQADEEDVLVVRVEPEARAPPSARSRGANSSVSAPLATISTRSRGTPKSSTRRSRRRSVTGSSR